MGSAGGVVYALAAGPKGIYAAGTYFTGNAYGSPYFTYWNGVNWSNAISFIPGSCFFAVPLSDPVGYDAIAVQGTNVYLGGNILGYTSFDPNVGFNPATNCQNIIHFDSNYGYVMGTGLNNTNYALATLGTNVYAGGLFTQAGGLPANQIAMWNGTTWSAVGGGVVGEWHRLRPDHAGQQFGRGRHLHGIGGVPVNRIAKWDGANWSALGNISGVVFSLAPSGSGLYAGGVFRYAGGKEFYNLAPGTKIFQRANRRPVPGPRTASLSRPSQAWAA